MILQSSVNYGGKVEIVQSFLTEADCNKCAFFVFLKPNNDVCSRQLSGVNNALTILRKSKCLPIAVTATTTDEEIRKFNDKLKLQYPIMNTDVHLLKLLNSYTNNKIVRSVILVDSQSSIIYESHHVQAEKCTEDLLKVLQNQRDHSEPPTESTVVLSDHNDEGLSKLKRTKRLKRTASNSNADANKRHRVKQSDDTSSESENTEQKKTATTGEQIVEPPLKKKPSRKRSNRHRRNSKGSNASEDRAVKGNEKQQSDTVVVLPRKRAQRRVSGSQPEKQSTTAVGPLDPKQPTAKTNARTGSTESRKTLKPTQRRNSKKSNRAASSESYPRSQTKMLKRPGSLTNRKNDERQNSQHRGSNERKSIEGKTNTHLHKNPERDTRKLTPQNPKLRGKTNYIASVESRAGENVKPAPKEKVSRRLSSGISAESRNNNKHNAAPEKKSSNVRSNTKNPPQRSRSKRGNAKESIVDTANTRKRSTKIQTSMLDSIIESAPPLPNNSAKAVTRRRNRKSSIGTNKSANANQANPTVLKSAEVLIDGKLETQTKRTGAKEKTRKSNGPVGTPGPLNTTVVVDMAVDPDSKSRIVEIPNSVFHKAASFSKDLEIDVRNSDVKVNAKDIATDKETDITPMSEKGPKPIPRGSSTAKGKQANRPMTRKAMAARRGESLNTKSTPPKKPAPVQKKVSIISDNITKAAPRRKGSYRGRNNQTDQENQSSRSASAAASELKDSKATAKPAAEKKAAAKGNSQGAKKIARKGSVSDKSEAVMKSGRGKSMKRGSQK